ncbi:aminoglycoside N(3)-acetyltransferase [Streptacidiphilus pinicola]|uniref:Aminoglycoside N(3)-acetyltransferase n=1 Tax=Streptacidiphilus pinicola TaxID=2219663 RepID=A0A2X0KD31_9ACTN|nr:AAC(3) family N-acetyltransferase [Streptacidiphilus pinicola]RAG86975.1 aminoglycoside N(3)-acetyltransferase [Streptacidiphilus pinicola]
MADWTEDDLQLGLKRLGVEPGGVLFVQASLRRVGPVVGGAAAVLRALRLAVGDSGTLVAYTATPENSRTSPLYRAATAGLSAAALAAYHEAMPPFDRRNSPCSPTMGRLSEELRRTPGALRSAHPQTSFAALGPAAGEITWEHPLEQHLGPDSPLGRLYGLRAQALLLGTGPRTFTPFHLLDYQRADHPRRRYSARVLDERGQAVWRHFTGLDFDDSGFGELGRRVAPLVPVRHGRVGSATAALVPLRAAVDAAATLPSLVWA